MTARAGAPASQHSARDILARAAIVALAYFLAAKLGLRLAFSNENVTSVWPPTGIAVAGLLLLGPRVWPGITLGALAANLSNGAPLVTTLGICVGNTLAPVVAAGMLRRTDFRPGLDRMRDVTALVILGGFASMLISATGGTASLAATDAIGRDGAGLAWLVWWIGDALGVILFAPVILTFATRHQGPDPIRARPREAATLVAAAAIAAVIVFNTTIPLPHLLFPFAIWAAVRFHQRGASALTVLLSGIAILETASDNGPFTGLSRTTDLIALQAFNGTLAVASLLLGAVTRERTRAQEELRRSADDLEERVALRTEELETSEERLRVALSTERETAQRLRVMDEFKDSLLTSVSHELRTPLAVIIGLATTLTDRSMQLDAGQQRELILRLEANAHRLDRLLADLLDVDRLNRGLVEPRPRATSLEAVARRALDGLDMKGHTVRIELGGAVAAVDPAHIERIVENLLSNAAKHTPPATQVLIRSEERVEGVVLIVEDTGPGVAPESREQIFEPFRRGDVTSHAPGTGVGLSLVAHFARVNGGRAWVEEREGGGASFRVLLPAPEPDRLPDIGATA